MTLKQFVKQSLSDLEGLEGSVVDFDISVYPGQERYGDMGVNVDMDGVQGLSRIKFSVELDRKDTKAKQPVEPLEETA